MNSDGASLVIIILLIFYFIGKINLKQIIAILLIIVFIFGNQIPLIGPALNYVTTELNSFLKEKESMFLKNSTPINPTEQKETKEIPNEINQETITAVYDDIKECNEKVFAKEDVLLIRNVTSYCKPVSTDTASDMFIYAAEEKLKEGNFSSEEEWEKYFNIAYQYDTEYNEMGLFEVKYSIPDYQVDIKNDEDTGSICILTFDNTKATYTSSCTPKSNLVVYGSIEGKSANEIIKSVPVVGSVVDLFDKFSELKPKFKRAKDDFGKNKIELLTAAEKLYQEALSIPKKRTLLKTLAKCNSSNKYNNVTINGVFLKKEGNVISDFSDEDLVKVFGKDEDVEYTFSDSEIGDDPYIKMDYNLFYEEETKVYRQMPKKQATAYNGKNPFTLYETLQNKLESDK